MRRTVIGKCLAAVVALGLMTLPAAADIVMQWASNNANVTQRAGMLVATGNTRDAARFEIVRLEGRRIALRASDGSYVRAGIGPQTLLGTGSPHIRGWETFEMDAHGDAVSLRSVQNGKFVTVDGAGQLTASSDLRGTHAQFRFITVPDRGGPARPETPAASTPRVSWQGQWTRLWIAGADGRGVPAPRESRARFTVGPDMTVSVTAGCNTLHSRMDVRGRQVAFSRVMSTRINCRNAQQIYEQHLASAMANVRSWDYREGQIAFLDASGRRLMQIGR
ncbi:META domain-containing protein [Ancylobacter radicis]|uniref:META domain-containing protein n=1 Tax=Ancylobacter radicis TaxID=2836179 RepID=A0ABS5RCX8_9HYPH|nr:META domain-containing protein [Ancylobacter radicis]MBS9478212.1 META domain-containing protein [Ancylobacter radicis]